MFKLIIQHKIDHYRFTGIVQKLQVSKLNEFIEDQFHECNEVISNSFIACETKIMGP